MYDIVIVEDKKITRDGLVQLVDWQSVGARVAAACSGGDEAREYLEHHHVDVVISDIEMDGGNGIELLRYVHGNRPQVKVIIISAYERFSYAHDALVLGAFGYVLKPLNEKELLAKTGEALEAIRHSRLSNMQRTLIAWERAGACAMDWLSGEDKNALTPALEALGEDFRVEGASCFVFHAYGDVHVSLHRLREIAAETGQPVLLFPSGGNCCCFLSGALASSKEVLQILCAQWAVGSSVRFGVSERGETIADWTKLFAQAHTALYHGFWNQRDTFEPVWFARLSTRAPERDCARFNAASLTKLLFSDDPAAALGECESVFSQWRRDCVPVGYALSQCGDALACLGRELPKDEAARAAERAALLQQSSGERLEHCFSQAVRTIFEAVRRNRAQTVRPIVKLALEYAIHHIGQLGLNLKTIAEKLNVSYVYLSKAFKEDFQTGFTECINNYRMELAKQYLDDPQMRVYEVCDKIGMEPKNFHHLFKKYAGMTPKEYQARAVRYEEKELSE